MQVLRRRLSGDRETKIMLTDATDGDFAVSAPTVEASRGRLDTRPWTWLRQVHGSRVVVVREPGEHAGMTADAAICDIDDAVLVVQSADCAPIAFWSNDGPFGVTHAGWRGLEAGVIEATVEALHSLGASDIWAVLGPCIHPADYEFGRADLDRLAERYGPSVRATTRTGLLALDVPATVSCALRAVDVALDHDISVCTGRSKQHFSHRVREDRGRQCVAIVRETHKASLLA